VSTSFLGTQSVGKSKSLGKRAFIYMCVGEESFYIYIYIYIYMRARVCIFTRVYPKVSGLSR
jgi:hypothetical protein